MSTRPRILVALDLGPDSRRILDGAVWLASRSHADLDLVHVLPTNTASLVAGVLLARDELEELAACRNALARLRDDAVPETMVARIHLRAGRASQELLAAIREVAPELVVVGTRGHGAIGRALLGSVSHDLASRSPAPVAIVRPDERRVRAEPGEPQHDRLVYSCARCGHLRGRLESAARCHRCGLHPGRWDSAPLVAGPADQGLEGGAEPREDGHHAVVASAVGVSPPGTEGASINPELRVRS